MSIDGTHDDVDVDVDDDYDNHDDDDSSCFLQYAWLAIPDAAGMHAEAHDVLPP